VPPSTSRPSPDFGKKVTGRADPKPTRSRCRRTPPRRNQNHHEKHAHQKRRNQANDAHAQWRLTNGRSGNSGAISAMGAIWRAVCAGHAIGARERASRNAPLAGFRLAVAPSFWPRNGAPRRCQSSLGYEPYDACVSAVPGSLRPPAGGSASDHRCPRGHHLGPGPGPDGSGKRDAGCPSIRRA